MYLKLEFNFQNEFAIFSFRVDAALHLGDDGFGNA